MLVCAVGSLVDWARDLAASIIVPSLVTATLCVVVPAPALAESCAGLRNARLPSTTIVAVTLVDSGKFVPPPAVRTPAAEFFAAFNALPAFCRVELVVRPSSDSKIGVEVWLPVAHWNGRYLGVGNGSFGGSINYPRLGEALRSGYATSSTDTGHRGAPRESAWAKGHPAKQTDFDYRAIHETAETAKTLVRALYGSDPTHSYFSSCSNGGRQGLMEAERYPADYDGILAGAPATTFGFRTFVSGDLRAFQQRGGKLIIYHGGADGPATSVAFYRKVRARSTKAGFLQLYLVPAMEHCGGGPEPNEVGQWLRPGDDRENSLFTALEHWVETGRAPDGVTATKFVVDGNPASGVRATRTLYPYPRAPGRIQTKR